METPSISLGKADICFPYDTVDPTVDIMAGAMFLPGLKCVLQPAVTVSLCTKVTVHKQRTVENIFNSFSPRSAPSLSYVRNERRPSLAVPFGRLQRVALIVWQPRGEQRHFHRRNFGFLSIRRAASWARGRVYTLVYSGDLRGSSGSHFPDNKWRLYK